jgi:hypothetical protein
VQFALLISFEFPEMLTSLIGSDLLSEVNEKQLRPSAIMGKKR